MSGELVYLASYDAEVDVPGAQEGAPGRVDVMLERGDVLLAFNRDHYEVVRTWLSSAVALELCSDLTMALLRPGEQ